MDCVGRNTASCTGVLGVEHRIQDKLINQREPFVDANSEEPIVSDDIAMRDLRTKMAHIQWRKHANDKGIRAAIDTSKRIHERNLMLQLSVDREGERGRRIKCIVGDELGRPAAINETFMRNWEQQEAIARRRQLEVNKLHAKSIKRIERALKSKSRASSRKDRSDSDNYGDRDDPLNAALKDRLKTLRSGIKEIQRELRRTTSYQNSRDARFSAKSFKTGRGRN